MSAAHPLSNLVRLVKNPEVPYIYDVELQRIPELKSYSSVEVHVVLYPYSRQVRAPDFAFNPYQEYADDVQTRRRSLYIHLPHVANSLFGIFLGILIVLAFLVIKPSEVASLQSIVAILGAYFIGKDLWNDIEGLLVALSHDWRVRYQTSPYAYQIEKNTTLTGYSALAREERYGKASLLSEMMDLIPNANSKTVRMYFDGATLKRFSETTAHILSIRVAPDLIDEFEASGFMFGVKISLNQQRALLRLAHEFFQSGNRGTCGCLDEHGVWVTNAVMERDIWWLRNIRYLQNRRVIRELKMLEKVEG